MSDNLNTDGIRGKLNAHRSRWAMVGVNAGVADESAQPDPSPSRVATPLHVRRPVPADRTATERRSLTVIAVIGGASHPSIGHDVGRRGPSPREETRGDPMSAPASERTDQKTTKPGAVQAREGGELVGDRGRTAIADTVVAKIAGMAAAEVQGVYAMGAGMARAFGAVRERIGVGGPNVAQGVAVEVGERQAAVDLDVIVEYGVSIPDLSDGIRRNVIGAVEKMCGLEVTEVNINVGDIHLPGEEAGEPAERRVK
jgi:uncharacterized alkaline shock family protein YloU